MESEESLENPSITGTCTSNQWVGMIEFADYLPVIPSKFTHYSSIAENGHCQCFIKIVSTTRMYSLTSFSFELHSNIARKLQKELRTGIHDIDVNKRWARNLNATESQYLAKTSGSIFETIGGLERRCSHLDNHRPSYIEMMKAKLLSAPTDHAKMKEFVQLMNCTFKGIAQEDQLKCLDLHIVPPTPNTSMISAGLKSHFFGDSNVLECKFNFWNANPLAIAKD